MKIIAVESQNGGSGKPTIAVHLAQAFASGGYRVLLLDLDPQTSAAEWKDVRVWCHNIVKGDRCPSTPVRSPTAS